MIEYSTQLTSRPSEPSALERSIRRWVAMTGLSMSMFLIVLDATMVNLATVAIRDGLGLSAAALTIIVNAYLVALAGLLLLGGRLSDVLGGRRVFLAGMALYLLASAFCALSLNSSMLIAGRIGQGVGAALVVPSALALVLELYKEPSERVRAMGIWGAVSGTGSLVGVFLGGMFTDMFGWPSVFWAPVPFCIVSALIVLRAVQSGQVRATSFDTPGAVTITLGIGALAFGIIYAAEAQWAAPGALAAIALGLVSIAGFVAIERRASHPLVPLRIFHNQTAVAACLIVLLMGATLAGLFFFLPQYQQQILGMDALTTGMSQIPLALMTIVGSAAAPVLARVIDLPSALAVGIAVLLAGFLILAFNPVTTGLSIPLMAAFILIGGGLGVGLVNGIALTVRDASEGESGLLSGLVNTAQQIGGALGIALIAGIAIGAGSGEINFTAAFSSQAILILIALCLALIATIKSRRAPNAPDPS